MIDSHVHFWHYDAVKDAWITDEMAAIKQDFLPADLAEAAANTPLSGCVAVQASQSDAETEFLLALSRDSALIQGIVGWTDLRSENLAEKLHHYRQFEKLKGFRHVVQAEADGFMLQPEFLRGLKLLHEYGYTYDILVTHRQLSDVLMVLEQCPGHKFVIDHCAKPDIASGTLEPWAATMRAVAAHQNVFCKVSGMITEAEWSTWSAETLEPYLDLIFDAFGTNRILFGSDWPVMQLAGTYPEWVEILRSYMTRKELDNQEAVFALNAHRFYNL